MVWFTILPVEESKIKVEDAKVNPEACQRHAPFEEQDYEEVPTIRKRRRERNFMISVVTETKERRPSNY